MLKVLFITRKWAPAVGGMETYSLELSKELSKICDLSLHVLPGRPTGKPPTLLSLASFVLSSMLFIVMRRGCDVIHIGDLVLWPLGLVARIFHPSARLVVTAYGLDIVYGSRKGLLPKIYRLYLALGVILIAKRLQVIAISNATAELCRNVGFPNVLVVTLGVSPLKTQVGEACDIKPYVLFVGRLVKRKGAAWFAENVLPLVDNHLKMVVVGKRWDDSEWNMISNNPCVEYRGVVTNEEIFELRRSAIAVLMPNIPSDGKDIEGFGLTALEAAADGGVLLASGIEGIVDAVVDGETGFLLPSEEPSAWAKKIDEICRWSSEDRRLFIQQAHRIIEKKYSWPQVAHNTLKAYQGCESTRGK